MVYECGRWKWFLQEVRAQTHTPVNTPILFSPKMNYFSPSSHPAVKSKALTHTGTRTRACAHTQTCPHIRTQDRITWSQGGAKTPQITNRLQPASSTCGNIADPFNQGHLPTSLIITLLSLPAGIEKATMELGWCVENKEDLNCDWEFNPLGGKMKLSDLRQLLSCISFHRKWILLSVPFQKHHWYLIPSAPTYCCQATQVTYPWIW